MKKALTNITLISLIVITAAVVRFSGINKYDLWFDELITDNFSYQNLNDMAGWLKIPPLNCFLEILKHDRQPPLYYGLVYVYSAFAGSGKSLRILSALFSLFSLIPIYLCARLLFNRRAGLYAMAIMALSPFQIWYAQEARLYALACLLSLFLILFLLQAFKTGKLKFWLCFTISAILAIYTSYYSILLVGFSGLALFLKINRPHFKKWFFSIFTAALFCLPLLPLLKLQSGSLGRNFWLPLPLVQSIILTFGVFNLGYSASFLGLWAALILSCLLFFWGAYAYYRLDKGNILFLISWFLLPVLVIYCISRAFMPIFISRHLIIFTPFWYLLIAEGIASLKNKMLARLSIAGICLLLGSSFVNYYHGFMIMPDSNPEFYSGVHKKKNYSDLLTRFFSAYKQGDLVTVTDIQSFVIMKSMRRQYKYSVDKDSFALIFYPYTLTRPEKETLEISEAIEDFPKNEINSLCLYFKQPDHNRIFQIEKFESRRPRFGRLWLVSSSWQDKLSLSLNAQKVREYMSRNYKSIDKLQYDGVIAELFDISGK